MGILEPRYPIYGYLDLLGAVPTLPLEGSLLSSLVGRRGLCVQDLTQRGAVRPVAMTEG